MTFHLRRDIAASLYFADLLGASLGALVVTFLLQAFGGENDGAHRGGAAAPRQRGVLSRRVAPLAIVGAVVLGRRGAHQRADGAVSRDAGRAQGHAPAHGRAAVGAHHADGMERVLAHRRRRGFRAAVPRAALHRLRRVDEHAAVGRRSRQRAGLQHVVPRVAVQARQAAARRSSSARAADRTCSSRSRRAARRSRPSSSTR